MIAAESKADKRTKISTSHPQQLIYGKVCSQSRCFYGYNGSNIWNITLPLRSLEVYITTALMNTSVWSVILFLSIIHMKY